MSNFFVGAFLVLSIFSIAASTYVLIMFRKYISEQSEKITNFALESMKHIVAKSMTDMAESQAKVQMASVQYENLKDALNAEIEKNNELNQGPVYVHTDDGREINLQEGWEPL